jgi:hypothetical protein
LALANYKQAYEKIAVPRELLVKTAQKMQKSQLNQEKIAKMRSDWHSELSSS